MWPDSTTWLHSQTLGTSLFNSTAVAYEFFLHQLVPPQVTFFLTFLLLTPVPLGFSIRSPSSVPISLLTYSPPSSPPCFLYGVNVPADNSWCDARPRRSAERVSASSAGSKLLEPREERCPRLTTRSTPYTSPQYFHMPDTSIVSTSFGNCNSCCSSSSLLITNQNEPTS